MGKFLDNIKKVDDPELETEEAVKEKEPKWALVVTYSDTDPEMFYLPRSECLEVADKIANAMLTESFPQTIAWWRDENKEQIRMVIRVTESTRSVRTVDPDETD